MSLGPRSGAAVSWLMLTARLCSSEPTRHLLRQLNDKGECVQKGSQGSLGGVGGRKQAVSWLEIMENKLEGMWLRSSPLMSQRVLAPLPIHHALPSAAVGVQQLAGTRGGVQECRECETSPRDSVSLKRLFLLFTGIFLHAPPTMCLDPVMMSAARAAGMKVSAGPQRPEKGAGRREYG